jgi:phospholipase C
MTSIDSSHRLDHVVVVMFENRSFDNLLGYLYKPGEVPSFEGVLGRDLTNPVPPEVTGPKPPVAAVHPALNMDTPDPDPGEEYPHINTQLYGTVLPPDNRLKAIDKMVAPFNAPPPGAGEPTMSGFVQDYVNSFQTALGRFPTYPECAQSMACYAPERLPVLSALARGFACFDHWFCEVPSQTYPNRSFFHAASSSGFVLNGPPGKFATKNDAPTIFEKLNAAGLHWRVYFHPEQILSATALVHARRLAPFFTTNFASVYDFFHDAREGKLPEYSFIEPNMFHPHADMHPPGASRFRQMIGSPAPDSIIGGERLLADVYNAVRTSSNPGGSNWANTLLLVTFDEHGGTYDHVPPPAALPPDAAAPPGEMGFKFDRSGVRIPTIAISPWVEPKTVVHPEYRSTSLIQTLRTRWGLGAPLTQRDASAADIAPILSRSSPRPPAEWPTVVPPTVPMLARLIGAVAEPFGRLERELLGDALAHAATRSKEVNHVDVESLSHRTAHGHMKRVGSNLFPQMSHARKRSE